MQNEGIAFGDHFKIVPKERHNFAFDRNLVTVKRRFIRYDITTL